MSRCRWERSSWTETWSGWRRSSGTSFRTQRSTPIPAGTSRSRAPSTAPRSPSACGTTGRAFPPTGFPPCSSCSCRAISRRSGRKAALAWGSPWCAASCNFTEDGWTHAATVRGAEASSSSACPRCPSAYRVAPNVARSASPANRLGGCSSSTMTWMRPRCSPTPCGPRVTRCARSTTALRRSSPPPSSSPTSCCSISAFPGWTASRWRGGCGLIRNSATCGSWR